MLSIDEKRWQRESDARTLAEAEQIKSSTSRLKGAKTEAKKMAKQAESQVKAMKKVAKPAHTKKSTGSKKATVRSNTRTPLSRTRKK